MNIFISRDSSYRGLHVICAHHDFEIMTIFRDAARSCYLAGGRRNTDLIFNILITILQCNVIFRNLLEFLLCTEKLPSERQIHRLYQTAEAIHGMENGENSDVNRKQGGQRG